MNNNSNTAIIVGSGGLIGSFLLGFLLEDPRYTKVVSVVRKPSSITHPKLIEVIADFDNLRAISEKLKADHAFCCLGTTIKKAGSEAAFIKVDYQYPLDIAQILKENGCRSYSVVTAMGADAKSGIFYNRVKGELQEALVKVGFEALNIFQPSLLMGERSEFRFGERVAQVVMGGLSFLFAGPLKKYKGIEGKTVAKAMAVQALQASAGLHIFESDKIAELAGTL